MSAGWLTPGRAPRSDERVASDQTVAGVRAQHSGVRQLFHDVRRLLKHPSLLSTALNARVQLHGAARLPFGVRVYGRVRMFGARGISFGDRVVISGTTVPGELAAFGAGCIEIGSRTFINYGSSISAFERVSIGRECLIGQYAIINDNDFHDLNDRRRVPASAPVVIEDRVWLGARVIVQKGVRIGHDSVIGAGSVVTRDIPPLTLAAGVPARPIRSLSDRPASSAAAGRCANEADGLVRVES